MRMKLLLFLIECELANFKYYLIETHDQNNEFEQPALTSDSHNGYDYQHPDFNVMDKGTVNQLQFAILFSL